MEHPFKKKEKEKFVSEEEAKELFRNLKVHEYLLVLSPHEDLWNKIMIIKEEFANTYNCRFAASLKPHITISKFVQHQMVERRIDNRLKMIAMGLPSFKIDLDNFGSFPTHTIYINVKTQEPIKAIAKKVKEAQKLMTLDKNNKPYLITEPHLTIARKLLPWQYEKAWLEYSNRHFSGSFMADHLLLLGRLVGDKAYKIINRYELMNLAVETKQGDLFG